MQLLYELDFWGKKQSARRKAGRSTETIESNNNQVEKRFLIATEQHVLHFILTYINLCRPGPNLGKIDGRWTFSHLHLYCHITLNILIAGIRFTGFIKWKLLSWLSICTIHIMPCRLNVYSSHPNACKPFSDFCLDDVLRRKLDG